MTADDVRKKLNAAKVTSNTKHYKVSIAVLADAMLAMLQYFEETKQQIKAVRPTPVVDETKQEELSKSEWGNLDR
jgi:hypothetical protein